MRSESLSRNQTDELLIHVDYNRQTFRNYYFCFLGSFVIYGRRRIRIKEEEGNSGTLFSFSFEESTVKYARRAAPAGDAVNCF